ncbi:MAG: helix-turn-helix domain-containing protein [Treponema sp.]|nr:helix-turn-helix domain-containing protein [Treponema sp.]
MGIKSVLGANLKYYRKKRGFSQEILSEKAGISARHLSFIENGSAFVSAELLEKLIEILRVSASALFYDLKDVSWDDTLMTSIDRLVEKEMVNAVESIKLQLRYLSGL